MKTKLITLAMILWVLSGCEPHDKSLAIYGAGTTELKSCVDSGINLAVKHSNRYTIEAVVAECQKQVTVPKKCGDK